MYEKKNIGFMFIFALLCDEVSVHLHSTGSSNKFHVLVEKLFVALWWKHSVQSNYAFLLSLKVKTWYGLWSTFVC